MYDSTISSVLKNPFYTGIQYQCQAEVVEFLGQLVTKNDKGEYAKTIGDYEPMISIEDFEKVAEIRESRRSKLHGDNIIKPSNDKWMNIMECGCASRF